MPAFSVPSGTCRLQQRKWFIAFIRQQHSANRQNFQRDVLTREATFQGLRFIAEGVGLERDSMPPEDMVWGSLKELINTGLFEDIYFKATEEHSDIQIDDEDSTLIDNFASRNKTVFNIRLHGRPWSRDCITRIPDIPGTHLSIARILDLNRAYKSVGQTAVKTCDHVHYYGEVSYTVQGKAAEYKKEEIFLETNKYLTSVKIRARDII